LKAGKTMSDLYSGTDLFSEFDRLQRQMANLFGGFSSSIRSGAFGTFPQVNIGSTDDSVEIVAFAPGINLAELDVSIVPFVLLVMDAAHALEEVLPQACRRCIDIR
jgi:HSP20 family molecular chaperone IbpA